MRSVKRGKKDRTVHGCVERNWDGERNGEGDGGCDGFGRGF